MNTRNSSAISRPFLHELTLGLGRPPGGQSPPPAATVLSLPNVRGQNVAVARVLVGVTGGIAAYKACELVGCSSAAATRSFRS